MYCFIHVIAAQSSGDLIRCYQYQSLRFSTLNETMETLAVSTLADLDERCMRDGRHLISIFDVWTHTSKCS